MTIKRKPAKKRKQEERDRYRAKGMVPIYELWVKPEHKEKVLQYAEGLNKK